jgi:hypothetical protein
MDVRREKTDIIWVGFYPLQKMLAKDKRSSLFLSPSATKKTLSFMTFETRLVTSFESRSSGLNRAVASARDIFS